MNPPKDCESLSKEYCETFCERKGCKYIKSCKIYPTLWKSDLGSHLDSKILNQKDKTKIEVIKALIAVGLFRLGGYLVR